MQGRKILIILGFICVFIAGCSQSAMQTLTPSGEPDLLSTLPMLELSNTAANRMLVGSYEMNLNTLTQNISISPVREPAGHMNVKAYIPAPSVQVLSYDTITGIVDANLTFQNPSSLNIFDMRMIVYSDNIGWRLKNPDDYTDLFDISGGMQINPFRAFACGEWHRQFSAYTSQTARVQLYFPAGSTTLNFAVDVSYPGNCTEPYSIQNWTCGTLKPDSTSSCSASVKVYDWQYNTDAVQFWCPAVSGMNMISFSQTDLYSWAGTIPNTAGAREGTYTGAIIAGSADSGSQVLYDLVQIQVEAFKPILVNSMGILSGANDVFISGNYMYITGYNSELIIANISDPISPVVTSVLPTTEDPYYIKVDRGYAYLREGDGNLRIVDVSDPYTPGEVINTLYTVASGIVNFDVSGNYVYVGAQWDGLIVVDVRDKRNPVNVGFLNLSDAAFCVTLEGSSAFVGTYQGFAIVDVRSPTSPELINHYSDGYSIIDCAVENNMLYAAGEYIDSMFSIFDVSDPMMPILKSRINANQAGVPKELILKDNCIYSGGSTGLVMLDVANPENPIRAAAVEFTGGYGIALKGDYAYVPDSFFGVRVVQLYQH